jgi:hypothetical protein
MGYIREPEGVDFVVDPRPLKDWEKTQISDIISHYKMTGEIKRITPPRRVREKATSK